MKCDICTRSFEGWDILRWQTHAGRNHICKNCARQLIAEAAAAKPRPEVRCSRCEAIGEARQMVSVDWLLCETCIEILEECLEGIEDCLAAPFSLTAELHLGSTAWKRSVKVRCLFPMGASEAEISVEKKHRSVLEQEHRHTVFDTYIVWMDGAIRGMISIPETEIHDSAAWEIHLADMLECDRVVAVDGEEFGKLFSVP